MEGFAMKASGRLTLLCATLLVIASCSDDSGGAETPVVIPTSATTATTIAATTLPADTDSGGTDLGGTGDDITLPPSFATLAGFVEFVFEDPLMSSGFQPMDWREDLQAFVSRESISGSGPGLDLLAIGPLEPAPAVVGLERSHILARAWITSYTGDIVPNAIVLFRGGPAGWATRAVIDSASLETALLLTTDYDAVAPTGPVAVETYLSLFDWTSGVFRAAVAVFDYSAGFELAYEGEIECTIGDPLECTTLSDDGILRPGDEGEDVEALQNDLATLGYLAGTIDGKYGSQTAAAVSAFQTDYLLTIDGRAGPQTLGLMADIIAGVSDLVLASKSGIGSLAFGTPADPAYGGLFDIFGPPDTSTGWYMDACDGQDWLKATWDGFTAIFTDREGFRQLDGWAVEDLGDLPSKLVIAGGIQPGWTWSDFEAAGAEFDPTYGAFFYMTDLAYNNGRFVSPPTNPPAPGAAIMGFGSGTGAFVTC